MAKKHNEAIFIGPLKKLMPKHAACKTRNERTNMVRAFHRELTNPTDNGGKGARFLKPSKCPKCGGKCWKQRQGTEKERLQAEKDKITQALGDLRRKKLKNQSQQEPERDPLPDATIEEDIDIDAELLDLSFLECDEGSLLPMEVTPPPVPSRPPTPMSTSELADGAGNAQMSSMTEFDGEGVEPLVDSDNDTTVSFDSFLAREDMDP